MPFPLLLVLVSWPSSCIKLDGELPLLLYLILLSWLVALDNGCSAMHSSLKATLLEYIYKWIKKGWNTQISEKQSHCSIRQTQDKVLKKIQLSFAKHICAETLVSERLRVGDNMIKAEKNFGWQFNTGSIYTHLHRLRGICAKFTSWLRFLWL